MDRLWSIFHTAHTQTRRACTTHRRFICSPDMPPCCCGSKLASVHRTAPQHPPPTTKTPHIAVALMLWLQACICACINRGLPQAEQQRPPGERSRLRCCCHGCYCCHRCSWGHCCCCKWCCWYSTRERWPRSDAALDNERQSKPLLFAAPLLRGPAPSLPCGRST